MKTFEFELQHDSGNVTIRRQAPDLATAKRQVLEAEKAPERAIRWWRVVPTERQIRKTKNLLRNL